MVSRIHVFSGLLLMLTLVTNIHASDTVSLQFDFTKKPPKAGVVYVVESEPAKKMDELDQQGKQFIQNIIVTDNQGTITFKNNDSVEHNIFAQDPDAGVQFDVGLMPVGSTKELGADWKEDTLVRVGCKIHPRMRAYIANFNSNRYSVIEFDRSQLSASYQFNAKLNNQDEMRLMLPKFEPISFVLAPGESKTFKLIRKGKERGNVTVSR